MLIKSPLKVVLMNNLYMWFTAIVNDFMLITASKPFYEVPITDGVIGIKITTEFNKLIPTV